ncbi:hypothetical protein MUP29_00670, partial [bacterium]|nr:hypothetical protein [bacterium]
MKSFPQHFMCKYILMGIISIALVLPVDAFSQTSAISVQLPGGKAGQLTVRSGMIDLQSLIEIFDLRSSLDVLGERLDLVGDRGSCRLLLESPLVLSRGLFALMSGPLVNLGGRLAIPTDFLTKALPALTGRSSSLDARALTLGEPGSGGFQGQDPE